MTTGVGDGVLLMDVGCWVTGEGVLFVGAAVCGWLARGLFCGSCVGCACACGMFKAGVQRAHIFNKEISKCRRLLLAVR